MQPSNSFSFLGIENSIKESPEKCRNNFLLLSQFVFCSKVDFHARLHEFVRTFAKTEKYLKYFQNGVQLKNFYLTAFQHVSDASSRKMKNFWNLKKVLLLSWVITVYELYNKSNEKNFSKTDWICISNFFPRVECEEVKYKWRMMFNCRLRRRRCQWTPEEDESLLSILRAKHPQIFENNCYNPNWSLISFELHKVGPSSSVKGPKAVRERWFNHLSPFLIKELWTLKDDLLLLEQTIKKQKKWSIIASEDFPHKNQHTIKNRVVSLMKTYTGLERKEIFEVLKEDYKPSIRLVIDSLKDEDYEEEKNEEQNEKIENVTKESPASPALPIKTEENIKKEPILTPNFQGTMFSNEEMEFYNNVYQNHMNLYLRSCYNNFNNMLMFQGWPFQTMNRNNNVFMFGSPNYN